MSAVKPFTTSADRVRLALRKRFCQPEWNLFFEVRDSTGFGGSTSADAVAMNCYPSRGMELWGMEIKVYRGDWLRELRDPAKSAPVQKYCDRWWIVAPGNVVNHDELPVTWGFMEVTDRHELKVRKQAPELKAHPLTREFVASMLRGSARAGEAEISIAVEERTRELHGRIDAMVQQRSEEAIRDRHGAMEKLKAIQAATGIDLATWKPADEIARAIQFAIDTGLDHRLSGLTSLQGQLKAYAENLGNAIAALKLPSAPGDQGRIA